MPHSTLRQSRVVQGGRLGGEQLDLQQFDSRADLGGCRLAQDVMVDEMHFLPDFCGSHALV